MINEPLTQVMILLAATVLVVAIAQRLRLTAILGYIAVGMLLGPYALSLVPDSETTRFVAEFGVVFLLFTLGLEFSLPRMLAMKHEVIGLGASQVFCTALVVALIAYAFGVSGLVAVVIGGAVAMSSTAIIMRLLTDRGELNRTHGRLSFSILLFQDLAFLPFLALATAIAQTGTVFSLQTTFLAIVAASAAVVVVLLVGRWVLRPIFNEIAHSRLKELFTIAVLFIVLASSWLSQQLGLSLALGGFLSGMMFAETEYRKQIESVIRPFRDLFLGLFFITVGMLLDIQLLFSDFLVISVLLISIIGIKTLITALLARFFCQSTFKAVRTGLVISTGGEFGIALLTVLLKDSIAPEIVQPMLVALILSMVLSPLILNHNKIIARFLLREAVPTGALRAATAEAIAADIAKREHVILCGFGRVGQSIARVLETQGVEYLALDLHPRRVRSAREAGDPVVFGDAASEDLLQAVGIEHASVVLITFRDVATIKDTVSIARRLRINVPIIIRMEDDTKRSELQAAGATDIVPETLEVSLTLASQALLLLKLPVAQVFNLVSEIRRTRYAVLRSVMTGGDLPGDFLLSEGLEQRSVVIPPGAWAVGKTLAEVAARGASVIFTALRRQGILGREPTSATRLREGDVVIIYADQHALEHAESVLLTG
jgi:monovalent cation:H+ antiporter-2, CPA2 family